MIAGRDAVGGGTWLGVTGTGRFAVVTNVRAAGGPDPAKLSRGELVIDMLRTGPAAVRADALDRFNPFNLIVADRDELALLTNRPAPVARPLSPGVHGLSNGLHDAPWPKTLALQSAVEHWIAAGESDPAALLAALRDETVPQDGGGDQDEVEPVGSPIFIRDAVYGTRCSTVVTVDAEGRGMIAERRFGPDGEMTGETRLAFCWPV